MQIYANIIHINHNMKFMIFLYETIENEFCIKFVQTYET
jgi:hypothetical protein